MAKIKIAHSQLHTCNFAHYYVIMITSQPKFWFLYNFEKFQVTFIIQSTKFSLKSFVNVM